MTSFAITTRFPSILESDWLRCGGCACRVFLFTFIFYFSVDRKVFATSKPAYSTTLFYLLDKSDQIQFQNEPVQLTTNLSLKLKAGCIQRVNIPAGGSASGVPAPLNMKVEPDRWSFVWSQEDERLLLRPCEAPPAGRFCGSSLVSPPVRLPCCHCGGTCLDLR